MISFFLAASLAHAMSDDHFSLQGYVVKFDSKVVVVESGPNNFEVPREKVPAKIREGEKIDVSMTDAEFKALKKTPVK